MEVLTLSAGGAPVALSPSQIERIAEWPTAVDFDVYELHAALESPRVHPAGRSPGRVLVCRDDKGRRVGFVVGAQLEQQVAPRSALYRVPQVLERLLPPPWLSGLLVVDSKVSLVVDLLALAGRLERHAAPRAAVTAGV